MKAGNKDYSYHLGLDQMCEMGVTAIVVVFVVITQIKPEDLQYYELFQCPRLETWHCYRKALEIIARVGL